MQRTKGLWAAVGVLTLLVIVLSVLLVNERFQTSAPLEPDSSEQTPPESPKAPVNPPAQTEKPEPSNPQSNVIARVGGFSITGAELQEQLQDKYGAELLQVLLDRKSVQLEASELGLKVNQNEMDQELKRMQQGYDSEESFYLSMKEQLGLSKEELLEDVEHRLLLEKIAIRGIYISDQQVEDYIREHAEEFQPHIQARVAHILTFTQEQADKVMADALKGIDFELLARAYSKDSNTANAGGDLGWIDEDDPFLPAGVMQLVRSLKPGEVGGPVAVDNGYEVLKVLDRQELNRRDPKQVREAVRKELALAKAPPMNDLVRELREHWKVEILDPKYK
ncbi:peptidylprolyl isomerase [Paenibacillus turpanensis]|uniref:peptidylprolyl isomerase n=1 Tax=Paenibacillus turpanensis TaxID=2689078 RepID=UPI001407F974|nr:peptidyl-prolyl cis-trans isomerase [Paenibacillus turpanensis]